MHRSPWALLPLVYVCALVASSLVGQDAFAQALSPGELFAKAQAASREGNHAEAEKLYRQMLAADPKLLSARVNLALACYWQHKNRQAVTEFRRALQASPREFSALLFSGLAYIDLGEYDRAQGMLLKAARVNDMDPLLFWALGSLAITHGDTNAAVALLERCVALDPNNVRAVWLLGQSYARLAYRREEKPLVPADYTTLALNVLRWLEERQPNSALVHVFKGDMLTARRLTRGALAEYRQALAVDPHWPDIHLVIGSLLGILGRWDEALAELRLQLQTYPDDTRALVETGSVHCRAGDYRAAVPVLREALAHDRNNYEANYRLGQAYVNLGENLSAVPALERATLLNPERADPHYLLSRAYRALKEPEKAAQALKRFNQLKASGPPPEALQ